MQTLKRRPLGERIRFACNGLFYALRHEPSLRAQVLALGVLFVGLLATRPSPVWWALFALSAASVLAAELANTALECLADAVHPEFSLKIRAAKDCFAAAVLICACGAIVVAVAYVMHLLA